MKLVSQEDPCAMCVAGTCEVFGLAKNVLMRSKLPSHSQSVLQAPAMMARVSWGLRAQYDTSMEGGVI
jgi:hypothetical protein